MTKRFIPMFLIIFLVTNSLTAVSQTRLVNPDSALQVILSQLEGTPLTLSEAMKYAFSNAASVREAEARYMAALGAVRREKGSFDPYLFFNLNYRDDREPTASFFSGAQVLKTAQTASQTGLRLDLPIGTRLEATLNTLRFRTNSAFAFLNPQYTAFGSLSFRQPLLGGFSASGRKQLSKAEEEAEAARARYDQEALATGAEVERRYWDLYAVERNYAVRRLTRAQAEAFLKDTELRAKTGLVGPNQVANARTFLAEQELALLDREEQLDRLSDELSSLIGVRPQAEKKRFLTVDDPPRDFPVGSVEALVERALKANLELQAAQADIEASRTMAKAAAWETLPSVNLVGALRGNGIGGVAQNVIFGGDTLRTTRGGGLRDAVNQAINRDFPAWSVGLEVSIPIGLRKGLGEQDRLEAEVMIAEQRYVNKSRILEDQVRSTYRELFHGKRRLAAAREGVDAAQEQVRIGLIEFQNGRSTAFEVVRLGADFAAAQQRYSEALVHTAKAAATLKQLTSGAYSSSPIQ